MALWHAGILHSTDDGEFINQNLMVLTLNLLCQRLIVVVLQNQIQLTEQQKAVLREHVPHPLRDDGNTGVDLYMKVCDVISAMGNQP